jgi:hypothetical protein
MAVRNSAKGSKGTRTSTKKGRAGSRPQSVRTKGTSKKSAKSGKKRATKSSVKKVRIKGPKKVAERKTAVKGSGSVSQKGREAAPTPQSSPERSTAESEASAVESTNSSVDL